MQGREGTTRPPRRHLLGDAGDAIVVSSITSTGNARFYGTGNPDNYDDSVNPAVYIAGGLAVNDHTYLNTLTVGSRFLNISDKRRKKKVVPKTHSIISQLVPMQYDLMDKDGVVVHAKDVGFMAQDLKRVDSSIVHVDRKGVHSVDYRAIGVHTVIELQRMIKAQEALLKKQEVLMDRHACLQEELNQLKAKKNAVSHVSVTISDRR